MAEASVVSNHHQCPAFTGYEKMAEKSHGFTGNFNSIKKWVVLEKIHGSNFSLTVWSKSDGDVGVRLGRRTAYLRAEEKFFKIETQLEFQAHLKKCAIEAWTIVNKTDGIGQIEAITIFGELFGGLYPHPSVPKVAGVSPIQREVVYCPDIKFCGFDIAVFSAGGERKYMDYDQVMAILSEAGFMYSKPLSVCSFEEAMNYKIGFVTHLPAQFGLPPIESNLAEGVVIKPMKELVSETSKGRQRVIFKRKIDKFSERKPLESAKKESKTTAAKTNHTKEPELLKYEMYALITEQRLVNAISKVGLPYDDEDKWIEIKETLETDVKETLMEENGELWQSCSPVVRGLLVKEMVDQCRDLISDYRLKI